MRETTINDELGNIITLKYNSIEDKVMFNNNTVDSLLHEVSKCNEEYGTSIICVDGVENFDQQSDILTRLKVSEFFWENKQNP
jgi:hypothetical protein